MFPRWRKAAFTGLLWLPCSMTPAPTLADTMQPERTAAAVNRVAYPFDTLGELRSLLQDRLAQRKASESPAAACDESSAQGTIILGAPVRDGATPFSEGADDTIETDIAPIPAADESATTIGDPMHDGEQDFACPGLKCFREWPISVDGGEIASDTTALQAWTRIRLGFEAIEDDASMQSNSGRSDAADCANETSTDYDNVEVYAPYSVEGSVAERAEDGWNAVSKPANADESRCTARLVGTIEIIDDEDELDERDSAIELGSPEFPDPIDTQGPAIDRDVNPNADRSRSTTLRPPIVDSDAPGGIDGRAAPRFHMFYPGCDWSPYYPSRSNEGRTENSLPPLSEFDSASASAKPDGDRGELHVRTTF